MVIKGLRNSISMKLHMIIMFFMKPPFCTEINTKKYTLIFKLSIDYIILESL